MVGRMSSGSASQRVSRAPGRQAVSEVEPDCSGPARAVLFSTDILRARASQV